MKHLLLALLSFTILTGYSQEYKFNPKIQKNSVEEVVELDNNSTPEALLNKAVAWAKGQENMTITDVKKEEGKVYFTGFLKVKYPSTIVGKTWWGHVNYKGKVLCKDGRYKYEFTDFVHEQTGQGGSGGALENTDPECGKHLMTKGGWNTIQNVTKRDMEEMARSLKSGMGYKKPTNVTNEDDW